MVLKYLELMYMLQELEKQDKEYKLFFARNDDKEYLVLTKKAIEKLQIKNQEIKKQCLKTDKKILVLESKSQEYHNEIRLLNKRIYSGKVMNMKELNILQDKVNTLNVEVDKVDNVAIKLLTKSENLKEVLNSEEKKLNDLVVKYQNTQLKLDKEIDKIKKEQSLISLERDNLIKSIPEDYLKNYYKIKRYKKDPIADIKNNRCNGCKMTVSNLVKERVKEHKNLVYCENCGRILFS